MVKWKGGEKKPTKNQNNPISPWVSHFGYENTYFIKHIKRPKEKGQYLRTEFLQYLEWHREIFF